MRELPVRKKIRLSGFDYSQPGSYFVTICTKGGRELFGNVVGTTAPGRPYVELTELGKCVDETIQIADKSDDITIVKYVIMPNHIHMIIVLENTADDRGRSSLQQVVRNIKSYITKRAGFSLWQPRFHDHIIRNESDYQRIWQYIDANPSRWQEDRYFTQEEPVSPAT